MSEHDAFEEDMDHELETFFAALRDDLPERLDPRIEGPLIKRLAATARANQKAVATAPTVEPAVARHATRRRFVLPARIAIAAALLVASMAGLAFAGVRLPAPVRSAFDGVGIALPNQAEKAPRPAPVVPANSTGPNPASQTEHHGGGTGDSRSKGRRGHPGRANQQTTRRGHSHVARGSGKASGRTAKAPAGGSHSPKTHAPSQASKSLGKNRPNKPPPIPTSGKGQGKP